MGGHMNLLLDDDIVKTLKGLKGNILNEQIHIPLIGRSGGEIFLKFHGICLSLRNNYDYRDDNDEYPTLRIELSNGVPTINKAHYKEKCIGQVVMGISIIRDHVEWLWNSHYWVMDNDIAIKFTFADKEITYSVENFMAETFYVIETDVGTDVTALYKRFPKLWTFKENVLKKFERTEIPL